MTNEEKAEELRKTALPNPLPDGYGMWLSAGDVDWVLIKMAEWKEQQIIEKTCEWLEDNLASFWQCKLYDEIAFINDFKQAIEE